MLRMYRSWRVCSSSTSISERGGATASSCFKMECCGTTRFGRIPASLTAMLSVMTAQMRCCVGEALPNCKSSQVFGETRVNVHALFEQLRREGDLTLVGAEAAISENKWKR